jgi:CubicO group peptidase (beta-lactamase class C family)
MLTLSMTLADEVMPMKPRSLLAALLLSVPLLTAAAAAAAQPATQSASGFSAERLQRIDRFMQQQVSEKHKVGVVVLLWRHGHVAYEKAYGVADLASGAPLRTDAIFRLFSMTKPITSVALLTLYEQGKFQLTDPLEMYVPAFKNVKVFAGLDADGHMILKEPTRKITIQDVMRHTAGFTYGYFGDTPVDRAYRAAGIDYQKLDSVKELTEKLATMPLLFSPGDRWEYSFAHDVQAYLVEYFSGMPFDVYCQKTIFGPLGMKDTAFGIAPARAARYPTNYAPQPDGTLKPLYGSEDTYERGNAHPFGGVGASATPEDYLRFARMLLNGGELGGVRILGPKTVELMTSDNLPKDNPGWHEGIRYGLGVSVLANPALAGNLGTVGSYGWSGYATTWVDVDPKEDLIALLFTQYTPRDGHFTDEFQTLVYQALVK